MASQILLPKEGPEESLKSEFLKKENARLASVHDEWCVAMAKDHDEGKKTELTEGGVVCAPAGGWGSRSKGPFNTCSPCLGSHACAVSVHPFDPMDQSWGPLARAGAIRTSTQGQLLSGMRGASLGHRPSHPESSNGCPAGAGVLTEETCTLQSWTWPFFLLWVEEWTVLACGERRQAQKQQWRVQAITPAPGTAPP